jgi:hypothetical protein
MLNKQQMITIGGRRPNGHYSIPKLLEYYFTYLEPTWVLVISVYSWLAPSHFFANVTAATARSIDKEVILNEEFVSRLSGFCMAMIAFMQLIVLRLCFQELRNKKNTIQLAIFARNIVTKYLFFAMIADSIDIALSFYFAYQKVQHLEMSTSFYMSLLLKVILGHAGLSAMNLCMRGFYLLKKNHKGSSA